MSKESLEEYLKKDCVEYKNIMWQYTNDTNDINDAIYKQDENWEGLKSPYKIVRKTELKKAREAMKSMYEKIGYQYNPESEEAVG